MTQTTPISTDRRGFVAGAAAVATTALVVPLVTQSGFTPTTAATLMSNGMQPSPGSPLGAYLKIDTNDVVTVIIGSTEMGQGILSGMAQLASAELMLDWSKVEAEHSVTTASNVAAMGNPQLGLARSLTLRQLQTYAPDKLSDDTLAKIDTDLAQVPTSK